MRVHNLVWDEQNLDHIAEHQVEWYEVEEAVYGLSIIRKGRGENRYFIYGQTESGLYLTVIADHEGGGWFYPVTAREMTFNERRAYREATGKK